MLERVFSETEDDSSADPFLLKLMLTGELANASKPFQVARNAGDLVTREVEMFVVMDRLLGHWTQRFLQLSETWLTGGTFRFDMFNNRGTETLDVLPGRVCIKTDGKVSLQCLLHQRKSTLAGLRTQYVPLVQSIVAEELEAVNP